MEQEYQIMDNNTQAQAEQDLVDRHVRLREDQIQSISKSAREEKRSWIMQLHYIIDSFFDKEL